MSKKDDNDPGSPLVVHYPNANCTAPVVPPGFFKERETVQAHQESAGGAGATAPRRKGPRKPRNLAQTVAYFHRLLSVFPFGQRRAAAMMLEQMQVPDDE